jgi:hypothetical protein
VRQRVLLEEVDGTTRDVLVGMEEQGDVLAEEGGHLRDLVPRSATLNEFHHRQRRDGPTLTRNSPQEAARLFVPAEVPDQDVRVEDDRPCRGSRTLSIHRLTSRSSARPRHIPNPTEFKSRLFAVRTGANTATDFPR